MLEEWIHQTIMRIKVLHGFREINNPWLILFGQLQATKYDYCEMFSTALPWGNEISALCCQMIERHLMFHCGLGEFGVSRFNSILEILEYVSLGKVTIWK